MHDDLAQGEVSVGSRCGAQTLSADALFGHRIRCLDDLLPGHRRRRPAVSMVPQPLLRALRPTGQVPKSSPYNNYPELSEPRIIARRPPARAPADDKKSAVSHCRH